jgi:hypothetical protein
MILCLDDNDDSQEEPELNVFIEKGNNYKMYHYCYIEPVYPDDEKTRAAIE